WMNHHDEHAAADGGDRRDVANEIEIELLVERRVDRVVRACQEDRVSVRGHAYDRLGADIAGGTRSVLDDEGLAKMLRQPLSHQARDDVIRPAGGIVDDQTYRPRRIRLRPGDARYRRQRGNACGQMQKLPTGRFHSSPSAACNPMVTDTSKL